MTSLLGQEGPPLDAPVTTIVTAEPLSVEQDDDVSYLDLLRKLGSLLA